MRIRTGLVMTAVGAVAALVFTLGASGAPGRTADQLPSCNPSNEYTWWYGYGAFHGKAHGSFSKPNASASWSFSERVTGNLGTPSSPAFGTPPGSIGGNVSAQLQVPGVSHTITFTAHCIFYVYSDVSPYMFAAYEGVVDLPPWSVGSHDAVLEIAVWAGRTSTPDAQAGPLPGYKRSGGLSQQPVPSTHAWIRLSHGTECSQSKDPEYRYTIQSDNASGWFDFKGPPDGNPNYRGRVSLPDGFSAHPGPVCDGIAFNQ